MTSNDPREPKSAPPSRLSPTEQPSGEASGPSGSSRVEPSSTGATSEPRGSAAGTEDKSAPQQQPGQSKADTKASDPLRGSKASGFWATVIVLVVVLILLAIFVLQNTQSVEISFLGFSGSAPLAAAMMISAAAGLVVAIAAGSLRILQLRRRVKRDRKA